MRLSTLNDVAPVQSGCRAFAKAYAGHSSGSRLKPVEWRPVSCGTRWPTRAAAMATTDRTAAVVAATARDAGDSNAGSGGNGSGDAVAAIVRADRKRKAADAQADGADGSSGTGGGDAKRPSAGAAVARAAPAAHMSPMTMTNGGSLGAASPYAPPPYGGYYPDGMIAASAQYLPPGAYMDPAAYVDGASYVTSGLGGGGGSRGPAMVAVGGRGLRGAGAEMPHHQQQSLMDHKTGAYYYPTAPPPLAATGHGPGLADQHPLHGHAPLFTGQPYPGMEPVLYDPAMAYDTHMHSSIVQCRIGATASDDDLHR